MPSVQIKGVPDDVHAELRRRAAKAGKSLQEYLLGRLTDDARLADVLDRVSQRRGGRFSAEDAAEALRAERDAR